MGLYKTDQISLLSFEYLVFGATTDEKYLLTVNDIFNWIFSNNN